MTNREWLNTLSNEDFIKWLNVEHSFMFIFDENDNKVWLQKPTTYTPTLFEIVSPYIDRNNALIKWLNEEREEIIL